jgi:hypothetical protein
VFWACDALKKKDGDAAPETPSATVATAPATPSATPTATATLAPAATTTAAPGTRVVKLADGGSALVNDAGQVVDASALAWTLPSGAPSAIVIPSAITIPSQITIPSSFTIPSGFAPPPVPGAQDAGKK